MGDYPAALERAKATGNDMLVLQRGSDWNLLGEKLYQEVWLKDAFVESLGKGFILVAVAGVATRKPRCRRPITTI